VKLVLATRNPHKVREFARLLPGHEIVPLPDDVELPPETGKTFAENAVPKARAAAWATGLPAIADDSGIQASTLGGLPGVTSARYAGAEATDQENLDKLRRKVPAGSPLAYECALAYADAETEKLFEGRCTGHMAPEPRGEGGFGYDPVFIPDERPDERTMAELGDADKDAISHRGRAARALLAWLGTR
jgi:XTP/dITP diphosphohydrolase